MNLLTTPSVVGLYRGKVETFASDVLNSATFVVAGTATPAPAGYASQQTHGLKLGNVVAGHAGSNSTPCYLATLSSSGKRCYPALASTTLSGDAVGTTRVIRNPAFPSRSPYSAAVRSRAPKFSSISRSTHFPGKSR
jgi:hypothetical protein